MLLHDLVLHRQHSFRIEAVVLRHSNWGEADRLLWLYTLELGKLKAVAKGVRKPRSRKAGHLEPFTRVNLQLARGRDLPLITQAETINAYLPMREDLLGATYASYIVELLDRFTYEEGENRLLYRLLVDTLSRLSQLEDNKVGPHRDLALRYYEFRSLDLVGFRPKLFHCASCENEIQPQDQYFSAQLGGVLCPKCGVQVSGSHPVSMGALKYMRHFQRSNYLDALRAKLTPALNLEIEALMQHFMTYLLERSLNSPAFLRRIRKEAKEREDA